MGGRSRYKTACPCVTHPGHPCGGARARAVQDTFTLCPLFVKTWVLYQRHKGVFLSTILVGAHALTKASEGVRVLLLGYLRPGPRWVGGLRHQ